MQDPWKRGREACALERLTKRSEQLSGGRGRRAQNRNVRGVHADSEQRPRRLAAAQ
ncbi:hypothetical protein XAC3612_1410043 [Xanthomonas citri pv. citri]|nr:hypothetical protein XAC3612_1410043 [Xanthomonas citri pv. citri]